MMIKHILTVIGSFGHGVLVIVGMGKKLSGMENIYPHSEWATGLCKGFTGGAWQLPHFLERN